MAEDLPEGISVDSVVGLAKVDETSVDWSLVFEGIAENLVEREQLVGGALDLRKPAWCSRIVASIRGERRDRRMRV